MEHLAETRAAGRLMDRLADLSERFRDRALILGKNPAVLGVKRAVEVNSYASGPMIECFLDAELRDGSARSWLLEVGWNGYMWRIGARLAISSPGGQHPAKEICDETASDLNAFLEILSRAADDLLVVAIDDPAWTA